MLPAILICAFMVKNAATQTVTTTLDTTSCVMIGDDVKLLCTVSSGCCSSSARVWEKGSATPLLNDGVSTDPSKYVEDYDNGTTGFNLIIKNVQKSDLLTNYKCVYGLKEKELFLDDILCTSSEVNESGSSSELNISGSSSELNISGNCWICAGTDFGYSFLGDVIGTVIILIITKVKIGHIQNVLRVGLLFIIGIVVNISVALPIGYLECHCVDGTELWFIVLGLVTSVITGGIPLIYRLYYDEDIDFCDECCCKVFGAVCSVPTVKVPRSSYVVTTGKAMILECTVTSCLPITSVQWQRNGGSITTVNSNTSGSTATTPSLTICKAASSDEGTYICFASNCVGTGQSTTITVAKQDPASGKKSKQDGDQELNEKEEKSQLLIK